MAILDQERAATPAAVSEIRCESSLNSVRNISESGFEPSTSITQRHSVEPTGVDPMFGGRHPSIPYTSIPVVEPETPCKRPVFQKPETQQMRLIGKLEALLSLAEKYRLMIEQQRRNIETLTTINQRQSRELQYLRDRVQQHEQLVEPSWRKLFDRSPRLPNVGG